LFQSQLPLATLLANPLPLFFKKITINSLKMYTGAALASRAVDLVASMNDSHTRED